MMIGLLPSLQGENSDSLFQIEFKGFSKSPTERNNATIGHKIVNKSQQTNKKSL